MNLRRQKLSRAFIAVSVLAATLCFNEFAVRFALPEFDPSAQLRFESGTDTLPPLGPRNTRMRQAKNTGDYNVTVSFNGFGFRDNKPISSGTTNDIYIVGDSYPFGWGTRQQDVVSSRMDALYPHNVFNLSIPGDFDSYQQLLTYAHENGADPQRVVLFVTMENDLRIYDDARGRGQAPSTARPAAGPSKLLRLKIFLTENFATYSAATAIVQQIPAMRDLMVRLGIIADNLAGARGDKNDPQTIRSSASRLARLATAYDTLVVINPSRRLWSGTAEEQAATLKWHEMFIEELTAADVRVLDLKPVFETASNGNPLNLFFANDPHWRSTTHDVIARAILAHAPAGWVD